MMSTPKQPPVVAGCAKSVFECLLDAAQYTMFKAKLTELIDSESDSLRFYQLGNHYKSKVEHVGLHPDFDQDGILFA